MLVVKRKQKENAFSLFVFLFQGKLMKFFAQQVVAKITFGPGIVQIEKEVCNYPQLSQFLTVVDIAGNMVEVNFYVLTLCQ